MPFLIASVVGIVALGALSKAMRPLLTVGPRGYGLYTMPRNSPWGPLALRWQGGLGGNRPSLRWGMSSSSSPPPLRARYTALTLVPRLTPGSNAGLADRMNAITAGHFPTRFLREDGRRTATANVRVVMDLLSRQGSASRADLARLTGLAPHSITRLVDPLIARRPAQRALPVAVGRGKPAAKLALNGSAAFAVGVSVMTDAVSLVLLDLSGRVQGARSERLIDTQIPPACHQIRSMMNAAVVEAGGIVRRSLVSGSASPAISSVTVPD